MNITTEDLTNEFLRHVHLCSGLGIETMQGIVKEYFDNTPHRFNAPDDNKQSRFCICGMYLTHEVHIRTEPQHPDTCPICYKPKTTLGNGGTGVLICECPGEFEQSYNELSENDKKLIDIMAKGMGFENDTP